MLHGQMVLCHLSTGPFVPSDHSTVIATPLAQDSARESRDYVVKSYRPLPESGILEFGEWICTEDWLSIPDNVTPTHQVVAFEKQVNEKLDGISPLKTVKINPLIDKPFLRPLPAGVCL